MSDIIRKILFLTITILLLKPFTSIAQYVYTDSSLQKQLNEARRNVCNEQFPDAIEKYATLVKNNDNKTVSAEYAYALALTGCYDGAIMNLDKIIASGQADTDVLFYISQVLKLMEYDSIADLFWTFSYKTPFAPSWISGQYLSLVEKYKRPASINTDDFGTALQRANTLSGHRQYIQAMVLLLELIETYPDQYLPYIGLSALLENLGFKKAAIEHLQKGIEKMGKEKLKIDSLEAYDKHLEKLKKEANSSDSFSNPQKDNGSSNTQTMKSKKFYHTGITYLNKTFALNFMYGWYTNTSTNFSLNLGYTQFEDVKTLLGDCSFNIRDKNEIYGITLSTQYSGGSFDFGIGAKGGWAIPLSSGSSSIDILLSYYYYFINKDWRATFSIGYTRYF